MAGLFLARHALALAVMTIPLTVWLLIESRKVNKRAYFKYLSLVDINSRARRPSSDSVQVERERGAEYVHPHLKQALEGPLGFDNNPNPENEPAIA